MKPVFAFVTLCLLSGAAQAATYEQQLASITHGQPRAVRLFIQRRAECNHWAGEEGYDAARLKQINAAVARLRCARLDRDEKTLRRTYRKHPSVLKALTQAAALN